MEENKEINLAEKEKLMNMFFERLPEMLNNTSKSDVKETVTLRVFKDEYLELRVCKILCVNGY